MSRIVYEKEKSGTTATHYFWYLVEKKIVSGYTDGDHVIIARYGINKATLKKLLEKSK